ncbi:MAG: hypothetical protein AAGD92_01090 [Pseudomonadota bacterium]
MSDSENHKKGCALTIIACLAIVAMTTTGIVLDNPGEVAFNDLVRASIILGAGSVALASVAFAIGGRWRFLGYGFPVLLFLFFDFRGFFAVALLTGLKPAIAQWVGLALGAGFAALLVEVIRRQNQIQVAGFLCIVTIAAAGVSVFSLHGVLARNATAAETVNAALTKTPELGSTPAAALPDIIYIVPDRYPSESTIRSVYGAENLEFLQKLEDRGFHVAKDARSNYPKTFQSLASTFNMADLSPLTEAMGPDSANRKPLYHLLENNTVQKTLRKQGYDFVYLGNWWQPARQNKNANINFYGSDNFWSKFSELERALLKKTPLSIAKSQTYMNAQTECDRIKAQLAFLKSARADTNKPVFVFAHLTIPHPPIFMNSAGDCLKTPSAMTKGGDWENYKAKFMDYLRHFNSEVIDIVDASLAVENGRDVIIAIQSDEGPYPKKLHENPYMDLFDFTDQELRTKFGIINALYWDEEKYGAPYLTQTPVNNWRIIFSTVFGADIGLIDHERSYVFENVKRVYNLRDVTERLEHSAEPAVQVAAGQ